MQLIFHNAKCLFGGGLRVAYIKTRPQEPSFFPFSHYLSPATSLQTMGLLDIVPAGVVTGDNLLKLFNYGMHLG